MKKFFVLPAIAAIVLSACSIREVKIAPGKVTVTGQIVNRDESSSRVAAIHFMNPFDDNGSTKASAVDPADGSFRIVYEMPYGQSFNIQYENRFIALYAEPGDSVHVTIDAARLDGGDYGQMIRYSGDKAELNTRFTPAYALFTEEIADDAGFYDASLSPDEFVPAVRGRIQASRDSLAAYARRESLTGEAVRLIDSEIVCQVMYYAGFYESDTDMREATNRLFSREIFDPFDVRYRTSQMYPYGLNQYLSVSGFYNSMDLNSQESAGAFLRAFGKQIGQKPKGLARDIMTMDTFRYVESVYPGVLNDFPEVQKLFANDYAWEALQKTAASEVPEFPETPILGISRITAEFESEPLPEADIFSHLAERHPGKAVYIDISAHWCAPCLAEIPHAKKLEESLAGEDVAFVILWMQSDFDRCTELIRKHDLRGESYFFSGDACMLFRGTYGFSGFPTYMLMDQNGKLVDTSAGRPSSPQTEGRIRELLKPWSGVNG